MKVKGFNYLGKYYEWTEVSRYQGIIDCKCEDCQKYIASLVKSGDLRIKSAEKEAKKNE